MVDELTRLLEATANMRPPINTNEQLVKALIDGQPWSRDQLDYFIYITHGATSWGWGSGEAERFAGELAEHLEMYDEDEAGE